MLGKMEKHASVIVVFAVVHLVEALIYNPEGHGFDSQSRNWNFSSTLYYRPHYGPGVDSASNRKECQDYFLWLRRGGLPVRLANSHNLPQNPGALRPCPGLNRDRLSECTCSVCYTSSVELK